MKLSRAVYRASLALAVVLSGPVAMACPVCFSAKNDDNATAFIITTAFLTFLPLVLFGGGVWWLRRRAREDQATHVPVRLTKPNPAPTPAAPPAMLPGLEEIPPAG